MELETFASDNRSQTEASYSVIIVLFFPLALIFLLSIVLAMGSVTEFSHCLSSHLTLLTMPR